MSFKANIKRLLKGFPGETKYWDQRYKSGGNSGAGSYGALAKYKASFLNRFISTREISSIIDFGCGDGNQLALCSFDYLQYTGLDISQVVLEKVKKIFYNKSNYQFIHYDEFIVSPQKASLTLSMDVIFHIIDDKKFLEYLDLLFGCADSYVIIYSSDQEYKNKYHVKDRSFSNVVKERFPEWNLLEIEENPFLQNRDVIAETRSQFFVYQRTE